MSAYNTSQQVQLTNLKWRSFQVTTSTTAVPIAPAALSVSGNVTWVLATRLLTITSASANGYHAGQPIIIAGATADYTVFNGEWNIHAITSTTAFTIKIPEVSTRYLSDGDLPADGNLSGTITTTYIPWAQRVIFTGGAQNITIGADAGVAQGVLVPATTGVVAWPDAPAGGRFRLDHLYAEAASSTPTLGVHFL